jgi:predicted nucleic acid-binding protein
MTDSPEIDQFVDTNILIYAFDHSAGYKHKIALQLVEGWWESETGCLSIQVLQEFYVTVTRKVTPPLERSIARQIVADLAQWRLHTPEAGDILQAIDFQQEYQLSFWDALIVQSATRLGCKQLFSEDMSDGQRYGDVQVINPFIR